MAFLTPPRQLIEVAVSDYRAGATTYRQRARFLRLVHEQQADSGECSCEIRVLLLPYAASETGEAGELLPAGRVLTLTVDLQARNDTLVSAADGAILAQRGQWEGQAQWQQRIDALSEQQDTMLQGDFFEQLRENQPVLIGQMIRQHIQQADAMGRFA